MTASAITRRGFVAGAAGLAAAVATTKAGFAAGPAPSRLANARLLVVLRGETATGGRGGWLNRLAARLPDTGRAPAILAVCRNAPPLALGPAPVAILDREALRLLPPARLAALLRGPGPSRIDTMPGAEPEGRIMGEETWARLGALLAEPTSPRLVVLQLGAADPLPDASLAALRAGLGDGGETMAVLVLSDVPRPTARLHLPGRAPPASQSRDVVGAMLGDHFGLRGDILRAV